MKLSERYNKLVEENIENIQHNYELIFELKDDLDCIKNSLINVMNTINQILLIKEVRYNDAKNNRPIR